MKKSIQHYQQSLIKNHLLAVFILLALAWLFFHSELSEPEIHNHIDHHFDYCQLVETVIRTHQPVYCKVTLYSNSTFFIEKERMTSLIADTPSLTNFPETALPLFLTSKQMLI